MCRASRRPTGGPGGGDWPRDLPSAGLVDPTDAVGGSVAGASCCASQIRRQRDPVRLHLWLARLLEESISRRTIRLKADELPPSSPAMASGAGGGGGEQLRDHL